MRRVLAAIAGFALLALFAACGPEQQPAVEVEIPPKPALLKWAFHNATTRNLVTQLTWTAQSPDGEKWEGTPLAAEVVESGSVARIDDRPSATLRAAVGTTIHLTAAAWNLDAPDVDRGELHLSFQLEHADETCVVIVLPYAGAPALALSCEGRQ